MVKSPRVFSSFSASSCPPLRGGLLSAPAFCSLSGFSLLSGFSAVMHHFFPGGNLLLFPILLEGFHLLLLASAALFSNFYQLYQRILGGAYVGAASALHAVLYIE